MSPSDAERTDSEEDDASGADDIDPVDARLRSLFADERLDVPARAGAEQTIVAGARRLRRRRVALSGTGAVAAVAALALGGVLLPPLLPGTSTHATGPGSAGGQVGAGRTVLSATIVPPTLRTMPLRSWALTVRPPERAKPLPQTPVESPPAASVPAVPPPTGLEPTGWGRLRLGMTFQEAVATGMLATSSAAAPAPGTCRKYAVRVGGNAVKGVVVSADPEVGIIRFLAAGARTPEGVGIGSSVKQLRAAYPGITRTSNTLSVSTGADSTYVFHVTHGTVAALSLVAADTRAGAC